MPWSASDVDIGGFVQRRRVNAPPPTADAQRMQIDPGPERKTVDAAPFQETLTAGFGANVAPFTQMTANRDTIQDMDDVEGAEQFGEDSHEHHVAKTLLEKGHDREETILKQMETLLEQGINQGGPSELCDVDRHISELAFLPRIQATESECEKLHQRLLYLPTSPTDHDNRVLCAAKATRPGAIDYPPCTRGPECVGCLGNIGGADLFCPGFTLMRYMTPAELEAYEANPASYTQPEHPTLCLLCLRYFSCEFLFKRGALGSSCTLSESRVFQPFQSKIGTPGDYREEVVMPLSRDVWSGFFAPVVMPLFQAMTWVKRPDRWVVDQSEILVPLSPEDKETSSVSRPMRTWDTYAWTINFLHNRALLDTFEQTFLLCTDPAKFVTLANPEAVAQTLLKWRDRWGIHTKRCKWKSPTMELSALHGADTTLAPPGKDTSDHKAWALWARYTLIGYIVSVASALFDQPSALRASKWNLDKPIATVVRTSRSPKLQRLLGLRLNRDHIRHVVRVNDKQARLKIKHKLDTMNQRFLAAPAKLRKSKPTPSQPPKPANQPSSSSSSSSNFDQLGRPRSAPSRRDLIVNTAMFTRLQQAFQEIVCVLATANPTSSDGTFRPSASEDRKLTAPEPRAWTTSLWTTRVQTQASFAAWLGAPSKARDGPWDKTPTEASPSHTESLITNVCDAAEIDTEHKVYPATVTHAFYKALPRRSQVREFNLILLTKLESDPQFRRECFRWTQATLLGLYRHCGVRLHPRRIQEFHALCAPPLALADLVTALLVRYRLVMLLVVREQVIFAVENAPFAEEALCGTFCFRAFRRGAVCAADRLRQLINTVGWGVLFGRSLYTSDAWFAKCVDGRAAQDVFDATDPNPAMVFPPTSEAWRVLQRGGMEIPTDDASQLSHDFNVRKLATARQTGKARYIPPGNPLPTTDPAAATMVKPKPTQRRPVHAVFSEKTSNERYSWEQATLLAGAEFVNLHTRQQVDAWFQELDKPSWSLDLGKHQRLGRVHSRITAVRFALIGIKALTEVISFRALPSDYDALCILFHDVVHLLRRAHTLVHKPGAPEDALSTWNADDSYFLHALASSASSETVWPFCVKADFFQTLAEVRALAWRRLWSRTGKFAARVHTCLKFDSKKHNAKFRSVKWPLPQPLLPLRNGGQSALLRSKLNLGTPTDPELDDEEEDDDETDALNPLAALEPLTPRKRDEDAMSVGSKRTTASTSTPRKRTKETPDSVLIAAVKRFLPQTLLQGHCHFMEESQQQLSEDFFLNRNGRTIVQQFSAVLTTSVLRAAKEQIDPASARRIWTLVLALNERFERNENNEAETPAFNFAATLPWMLCFGADPRAVGALIAFCCDFARGIARDATMQKFVVKLGEHTPTTYAVWLLFLYAFECVNQNLIQREPYAHPHHNLTFEPEPYQLYVCEMCSAVFSAKPGPGVLPLRLTEPDFCGGKFRRVCCLPQGAATSPTTTSKTQTGSPFGLKQGALSGAPNMDTVHGVFGPAPLVTVDLRDCALHTTRGWYCMCFNPSCGTVLFFNTGRGGRLLHGLPSTHHFGNGIYCDQTCANHHFIR